MVTRQTCRKLESCMLRMSKAFSSWGVISVARALPADNEIGIRDLGLGVGALNAQSLTPNRTVPDRLPPPVRPIRGQFLLRHSRAFYQGHGNLKNRCCRAERRSAARGERRSPRKFGHVIPAKAGIHVPGRRFSCQCGVGLHERSTPYILW